jgi:hypothetical protein
VAVLRDSTSFGLGLLDFGELLSRSMSAANPGIRIAGAGMPAPVERSGVCATDGLWNWGDPDRPWAPCGSHMAVRASAADVHVLGGVGQGLLVVDGGVRLSGGTRFYGLIIAKGGLRLEEGASLDGFALAEGGVVVAPSSQVRVSACWATRALAAAIAILGAPIQVPGTGRLGPLGVWPTP